MAIDPNTLLALQQTFGTGLKVNYGQPAKPQTKGRGGLLSSLIAEIGGTGGALGGAAAGAAAGSVVPGIGTVIGGLLGAGLGGFAGGTAGQAVEKKVRDNQNFLGKGGSAKSALGYGALTGALSAVPLGGVGKVVRGGEQALAKQTAEKGLSNKVANSGVRMGSRAAGIGAGERIGGQELTAPQSQQLYRWAVGRGMPKGHPEKVNAWAVAERDRIGQQLADEVGKTNTRIKPTTIAQDFRARFEKNAALRNDPAARKVAGEIEASIKKFRTNKGVIEGRRNFQDSVNYNRLSGKSPTKEQVHQMAIDVTDNHISKISPTVKAINGEYSKISKVVQGSTKQAQRQTRMSEYAGGGVLSKMLTGDAAQTTKSYVGGTAARLGGATKEAPGSVPGAILTRGTFGRELAKQGLGKALLGGADPLQVTPQDAQTQDLSQTDLTQLDPTMGGATDVMGAQTPQDTGPTYTLQNALADSQRDPKHASDYLAYAKAFADQAQQAQKATGPNVTKVTAQQYSLAQRGQQALQQMAQLLQDNPQVLNRTATPGRKLPIVGGFISNAAGTGDFDAIGYNIASSLLRIETGAQANESEIRNLQSQMIPRAGDSQQTIARKMQQLNQAFSVIINAANPSQNSSTGLGDVLSQYGLQ